MRNNPTDPTSAVDPQLPSARRLARLFDRMRSSRRRAMSMGPLSNSLHWLLSSIKFFVTRRSRFLRLTPAIFSKKAYFFDVKQKDIFSVCLRDLIDSLVADQIFSRHDYNLRKLARYPDIERCYDAIMASGLTPLIIDCGGNIGLATRYFTREFREARLVCVEPEKKNLMQARLNNRDSSDRIRFVSGAVGSEDGCAIIKDEAAENWRFQVQKCDDGEVRVFSVDSICAEEKLRGSVPFIIKIDIEGAEGELFSKNTQWLTEFPIVIIELHDWMMPGQATSRNVLRELANHNRDFVTIGENHFSIMN